MSLRSSHGRKSVKASDFNIFTTNLITYVSLHTKALLFEFCVFTKPAER